MRWFLALSISLILSLSITAQDFPEGRIAYTRTIECETFGYCSNGIKIIDPNTGESFIIDTGKPNSVWGESLSLSPDGRYIAYMTYNLFHITDVETGKDVGQIEFFYDLLSAVKYEWHPTKPIIAFVYKPEFDSPYRLFLFDLISHEWQLLAEDLSIMKWARPSWSPKGDYLIVPVAVDGENWIPVDLYLIHIATGQFENLTNHPSTTWTADWLSTGQKIVYSAGETRQNEIVVLDIETGHKETIYKREDALIAGTQWVLNESAILFWMEILNSVENYGVYLLDLETGDVQLALDIPPYFRGYVNLSPDRTAIVYLASEDSKKPICIVSLITFEEHCLEGEFAHYISYVEWEN